MKTEIEAEVDRWPAEDGVIVLVDGKLRYSRPCEEPYKDVHGRMLCVGHVVFLEE